MEWFIATEHFYDNYGVYGRVDGKMIKQVQFEIDMDYKPGGFTEPMFSLPPEEAQKLMNELWKAGIRPHNGEGTNSQTEAIKYHLEDMRKLVFKKE